MIASLGAAACGGGIPDERAKAEADSRKNEETAAGAEELSGTIRVDGSSTVAPLTEAAAELFAGEHPKVRIPVGTSGTGGGFEKFCNGEIDVADASRPIKEEEAAACEGKGIVYHELQVANDGIAVVVNPENSWAKCLTVAQLRQVWDEGSTVKTWRDVDPKFPAERIERFGPGTDSGTFDYFTEAVNGEKGRSTSEYTQSEDDNVVVEGVAGTKGGIGYFGLSYYEQNTDKLSLVEVDAGAGCVGPSTETVQSGGYVPLARPLFIYVTDELMGTPQGEGFVSFYVENITGIAEQALFVDLNDDQREAVLVKLEKLLKAARG